MRYVFLILLLKLSVFSNAQLHENTRKWNVKTNLTSLVDIFSFPCVQIAVGTKITNHVSLNIEGGNQFYNFYKNDTVFYTPKGFKLNADCRYYFSHIFKNDFFKKYDGWYFGVQGFIRKNQYNASIRYHSVSDSSTTIVDYFGVKKKVWGFNFIAGYELLLTKRIICDVYVGLGVRYKIITNTNRHYINSIENKIEGVDLVPYFQYSNLSESSGESENVIAGIRIGFTI